MLKAEYPGANQEEGMNYACFCRLSSEFSHECVQELGYLSLEVLRH